MPGHPFVIPNLTNPRPARSFTYVLSGQSQQAFGGYSDMGDAYREQLALRGVSMPNGVNVFQRAFGGSWMSRVNYDAWLVNNPLFPSQAVFVNDTGALADDVGLTATVADMLQYTPLPLWGGSDLCAFSEAAALEGSTTRTVPQVMASYRAGLQYYIGRLRLNMLNGNTAASKISVMMIGRTLNAQSRLFGYARARDMQLNFVATTPGAFVGAETYGFGIRDTGHLATDAQIAVGREQADNDAREVHGIAGLFKRPWISGYTKLNNYSFQVQLACEAGENIKFPEGMPCGFGFAPASFNHNQVITAANSQVQAPVACVTDIANKRLTFTLAAPIADAGVLHFPRDIMREDFNPALLITGLTSKQLLGSWPGVWSI
jgi:hypothetical protein